MHSQILQIHDAVGEIEETCEIEAIRVGWSAPYTQSKERRLLGIILHPFPHTECFREDLYKAIGRVVLDEVAQDVEDPLVRIHDDQVRFERIVGLVPVENLIIPIGIIEDAADNILELLLRSTDVAWDLPHGLTESEEDISSLVTTVIICFSFKVSC